VEEYFSQLLNKVRMAEALVPGPSRLEVEIAIAKFFFLLTAFISSQNYSDSKSEFADYIFDMKRLIQ
jgi:hypothetical protein